MHHLRLIIITLGILVWIWGFEALHAQPQQEVFTSPTSPLDMPEGITTDAAGNIVAHSNGVAVTQLIQFAPSGTQLAIEPVGTAGPIDSLRFKGSRLDTDPVTGRIYLLSPNGDILRISPNNMEEIPNSRIDIRTLLIDSTSAFDINAESSDPFIFGLETVYGDISVFHSQLQGAPEQLELFVTGLSDGQPFVIRLKLNPVTGAVKNTKVVLTSTAPIPPSLSAPRGVAVNSQGIGLTTLPISPTALRGCPDAVVTFIHDFTEGDLPLVLPNSEGIPSWGMTAGGDDNFYLATGGVGNPACIHNGVATLVTIPASLSPFIFDILSVFPAITSRPQDVTVSPLADRRVYMTISTSNAIVRFPATAPLMP